MAYAAEAAMAGGASLDRAIALVLSEATERLLAARRRMDAKMHLHSSSDSAAAATSGLARSVNGTSAAALDDALATLAREVSSGTTRANAAAVLGALGAAVDAPPAAPISTATSSSDGDLAAEAPVAPPDPPSSSATPVVHAVPDAPALKGAVAHRSVVAITALGAHISLLLPSSSWNGGLLIHAHGHRPVGEGLAADIDPTDECYRRLLQDGWVVSMTSYRREGVTVGDAMRDVDNVRYCVTRLYGAPRIVLVEGRSMGGCIATHLMERRTMLEEQLRQLHSSDVRAWNAGAIERGAAAAAVSGRASVDPLDSASSASGAEAIDFDDDKVPRYVYDGAVCCGAALHVREAGTEDFVALAHEPRAPLLYLTNEDETGPIETYIAAAQAAIDARMADRSRAADDGTQRELVLPALWEVSRPGHNRVSASERYEATRHMCEWVRHGTFITMRRWNATHRSRARDEGWARVTSINVHGGLFIDMQPADMARAGARHGKWFTLTVAGDPESAFGAVPPRATALVAGSSDGDAASAGAGASNRSRAMEDGGGDGSSGSGSGSGSGADSAEGARRVLRVHYGTYPFVHVPRDSWIAYDTPDSGLCVAVNTFRFCNPAAIAGVKVGDFLRVGPAE